MDRPWDSAIKKTKQLQIFAGVGVANNTSWSGLLDGAIAEFGKLSSAQRLGITYVRSTAAPDENGPGGAQVRFEVRPNGTVSYTVFSQPVTVTVGTGLTGGNTKTVIMDLGGVQSILKAIIVLPGSFSANTPKGPRDIGDGVKLAIIIHEMIHACGLDKDGVSEAKPDVFFGTPQLDSGTTPADDKLRVGKIRMPPVVISSETATRIQKIWT